MGGAVVALFADSSNSTIILTGDDFVSNSARGGQGTLQLFNCRLTANDVIDGKGGTAGPGGVRGRRSHGLGGGLYVAKKATAIADADTDIRHNKADSGRNEWEDW